jgi:nitrate reductase NapE component
MGATCSPRVALCIHLRIDRLKPCGRPDEQEEFLTEGRFEPSSAKRNPAGGCLLWLVVCLFPIPFSPWRVGLICLGGYGLVVYLLARPDASRG